MTAWKGRRRTQDERGQGNNAAAGHWDMTPNVLGSDRCASVSGCVSVNIEQCVLGRAAERRPQRERGETECAYWLTEPLSPSLG